MDDLLPDYESELALLRRSLGEFAQRYPKAAARLAIAGERSEDPHVERLIQSAALLNARVSARLTDNYPELPTAMLEILDSEYLRPFPSCSIAHFEGTGAISKLTNPLTIKRGVELKARIGEYLFRTIYDVVFAPLRITDARYTPATLAPANVRLHENTTAIVSITFAAHAVLGSGVPDRVRVFVDGDRRMVAATIDTLLLRTSNAFVEAEGCGTWIALDAVPVSACGFDLDEALIERRDDNQSRFRILLEYFSFPEKFDFLHVDLSALIRTAGPCRSVTLHLPIRDLSRDSAPAQRLQALDATHFKLFCTPVINLFSSSSEPLPLEKVEFPVFPIVPSALNASEVSSYRVDAVRLTEDMPKGTVAREIEPYHSFAHHVTQHASTAYWLAERDDRLAEFLPGRDMLLSLVDGNGQLTSVHGKQIDMDLTCTNGNLPSSMRVGDSKGDLVYASETLTGRISMLRLPTESVARPNAQRQLWGVVGMLSAGALSLTQAGLPAFKQLMAAHVSSRSSGAMRHIDSMTYLARESVLEWVQMEPQPMLVRGIRVRLAVDEARLVDCVISAFARMIESVLRYFAPENSFVQLLLISQNGVRLFEGRPLPGEVALI
ncbi:type VI secretion system baseplate subunit TssF [Trinickia acidisoli]|uniref:type VI secretion system baseplate subunit TssF n=1 Tax=Trinickia acidisoli TaxID=2767482 RepID=UPI001A8EC222|nr:type VI secretion system baseplate subunit TssF [Trinickia acidisoli]